MKKLFTMLMAILMLFSLAACSKNEPADDATVTQNVDVQVSVDDKSQNVELEEVITEQTMIDALTELGYGETVFQQAVGQDGMNSWAGTIINPLNQEEAEHTVDMYAIVFNYEGHPDEAKAKLESMREISGDFEIFMADIEDEMVVVIGGNNDYYDVAMELIEIFGY